MCMHFFNEDIDIRIFCFIYRWKKKSSNVYSHWITAKRQKRRHTLESCRRFTVNKMQGAVCILQLVQTFTIPTLLLKFHFIYSSYTKFLPENLNLKPLVPISLGIIQIITLKLLILNSFSFFLNKVKKYTLSLFV